MEEKVDELTKLNLVHYFCIGTLECEREDGKSYSCEDKVLEAEINIAEQELALRFWEGKEYGLLINKLKSQAQELKDLLEECAVKEPGPEPDKASMNEEEKPSEES